MAVPLLDLSRQYAYLKDELNQAVLDVLEHGKFILGPEVTQLESEIASLSKVSDAIGVASGTDALMLALHGVGVGPGDEVITTNFSFFATAGVIHRLGARPVLVDIEPDTYNLDPKLLEQAITPRTKAIMPVHLFGQLADMDPIMAIAKANGIKVVEDAAQAIGAEYKGRPAGSIGHAAGFSFYPSKNLGACGDGGIITCRDSETAELIRLLRVHGAKPKYYHKMVGYNSRLATIQAATLLVKIKHLRKWSEQRQAHARVYDEAFADLTMLKRPVVKDYSTFHIYNQYTISVSNRDELVKACQSASVGCDIYYPVPFHVQECFAYLGYGPDQFPVSTKAGAEVVSIPIYPEMTEAEQQEVIAIVRKVVS